MPVTRSRWKRINARMIEKLYRNAPFMIRWRYTLGCNLEFDEASDPIFEDLDDNDDGDSERSFMMVSPRVNSTSDLKL